MAFYKSDIVNIELENGTIFRSFMNHSIGSGDVLENRFGVRVFRNGEPEDIGGTVMGLFMRADGGTVTIASGTVSGNEAYITLPEACYAVEGNFSLAIKCQGSGVTGTLRIVDGVVSRTSTDVIVDPGTILPSIEDLIDAIDEAVASIPPDYSALVDEVDDLNDSVFDITEVTLTSDDWEQGGFQNSTGANSTSNSRIRTKTAIPADVTTVYATNGFQFIVYAWSGSTYVGVWNGSAFIKTSGAAILTSLDLQPLRAAGAEKIRLVGAAANTSSNISPSDGVNYVLKTVVDNVAKIDHVNQIIDTLHPVTNLANPASLITGSVWSGVNTVYSAEGYSRQELTVEPETTYTANNILSSFSWFTNDSLENLGNITDNPFTTPPGCTKIRLGQNGTGNFVVVQTGLSSIPVYDDYPYGVYKTDVDALEKRVGAIENDAEVSNYTSLSVFSYIGVVGDSYSSGGIYGVTGVTGGAYYDVSWPQVLARKCGFDAFNYSVSGIDVSGWLSNTERGLPKLQSDPAKQLYVVVMGINTEKQIADPTQDASTGTVSDIDVSDPSQNADTFCGHYGRMLSGIIDHAPDAKIILVRPLITAGDKLTAISNIGTLFSLPVISMSSDWYYKTDFYQDNRYGGHPIALTYAGMALAFERQIRQCMIDNISYFTDLT